MAKQKNTAVPKNSLVDELNSGETIANCAQAVAFMADAIPSICHGGVLDKDTSHGASWLLNAVREALDYEAARQGA